MQQTELIHSDMNCAFVIFGGTGDLTKRKLIPAVYRLLVDGNLPDSFSVVAVGRREKTSEIFRQEMQEAVRKYSQEPYNETSWKQLEDRIHYIQFDFQSETEGYTALDNFLQKLDHQSDIRGNRLFYLAVAPEYFEVIVRQLQKADMLLEKNCWRRVMVEKPFGTNLETARLLNKQISALLPEDKIFRIDHYLGKEMIQNIQAIRFGNSLFEPLWNNHYIDNVQITSTEMIGVENRGGYYEGAGILKDMLQNHILQMLTLLAMEPPVDLSAECIRDEKVKVLRSLRIPTVETVSKEVVRGQYGTGIVKGQQVKGYREEDRVNAESHIDTFIAIKAHIDNFRWSGVPFYIRSGKRLNRRTTEIVIEFKRLPGINTYDIFQQTGPNLLVLKIQPREGFFFQINAKRPGSDFVMTPVQMDYCQNCQIERNSPEAYERLILEAMKNNTALFTRWDELEYSWRFIEGIEQAWRLNTPDFPNYAAGSDGPKEAVRLIEQDGRHWWDLDT